MCIYVEYPKGVRHEYPTSLFRDIFVLAFMWETLRAFDRNTPKCVQHKYFQIEEMQVHDLQWTLKTMILSMVGGIHAASPLGV